MGFKRVDCGYSQLNFHAYFIVSLELRYVMAITSFSECVLCSVTHSPSQKETPMLQLFSTSDSGGHQMLKVSFVNSFSLSLSFCKTHLVDG